MRDLAVRLAALDPEAGAALRVVAYFDELAAGRAGLHAVVRGAAALTGTTAGFRDERRHLQVRIDAGGHSRAPRDRTGDTTQVGCDGQVESGTPAKSTVAIDGAPAASASALGAGALGGGAEAGWLSTAVDDGAHLWLERTGPPRVVDAVVLERAAALARAVLERTRPLAPGQDSDATGGASSSTEDVARDAALHEVLLDPVAPTSVRRHAARALRLDPSAPLRAVALHDGEARVVSASETVSATVRAGIGPAVLALDLPASLIAARRALRFSAAGTMADPGPRTVHADEVQALLLLAETITPDTPPIPDVIALDRAAGTASWVLATLQALVTASTRRAAAAELGIHHSTLQERLSTAQHVLGWDLHDPAGQQRLHLALALRRLHRNPR